jgi:hypothetical protein
MRITSHAIMYQYLPSKVTDPQVLAKYCFNVIGALELQSV